MPVYRWGRGVLEERKGSAAHEQGRNTGLQARRCCTQDAGRPSRTRAARRARTLLCPQQELEVLSPGRAVVATPARLQAAPRALPRLVGAGTAVSPLPLKLLAHPLAAGKGLEVAVAAVAGDAALRVVCGGVGGWWGGMLGPRRTGLTARGSQGVLKDQRLISAAPGLALGRHALRGGGACSRTARGGGVGRGEAGGHPHLRLGLALRGLIIIDQVLQALHIGGVQDAGGGDLRQLAHGAAACGQRAGRAAEGEEGSFSVHFSGSRGRGGGAGAPRQFMHRLAGYQKSKAGSESAWASPLSASRPMQLFVQQERPCRPPLAASGGGCRQAS